MIGLCGLQGHPCEHSTNRGLQRSEDSVCRWQEAGLCWKRPGESIAAPFLAPAPVEFSSKFN